MVLPEGVVDFGLRFARDLVLRLQFELNNGEIVYKTICVINPYLLDHESLGCFCWVFSFYVRMIIRFLSKFVSVIVGCNTIIVSYSTIIVSESKRRRLVENGVLPLSCANQGKTERVGRMLEMHANNREEIKQARAGDIVALCGLKVSSSLPLSPLSLPTIQHTYELIVSVPLSAQLNTQDRGVLRKQPPPPR